MSLYIEELPGSLPDPRTPAIPGQEYDNVEVPREKPEPQTEENKTDSPDAPTNPDE